jgi:hypothetical protein
MSEDKGQKDEGKLEVELVDKLVFCPLPTPSMAVSLEECMKCQNHNGVKKVSTPDGMPQQYDVSCGFPVIKRVQYLVKGVVKDGSAE